MTCCKEKDCNKIPHYNFPNTNKGVYCKEHKLESMIDVKHEVCKEKNCNIRPCFNYEDKKSGIYCKEHKLDNMFDVTNKSCKEKNCLIQCSYNFKNLKALYCVKHKLDDMVDVINTNFTCKSCMIIRSQKKYDNFCTHCFSNLFPSDPRTLLIQKKSKEIKVVSFITNKNQDWYHDKPLYVDLKGGCCNSKRRIDLRKLINGTLLCIEIDENQHKYYNKQDELDRYDNLFMDFSGKYVFIRYNPDKYKENEKVKNPRFESRMKKLEEEIEKQIKRIEKDENIELVEIINLFYDC